MRRAALLVAVLLAAPVSARVVVDGANCNGLPFVTKRADGCFLAVYEKWTGGVCADNIPAVLTSKVSCDGEGAIWSAPTTIFDSATVSFPNCASGHCISGGYGVTTLDDGSLLESVWAQPIESYLQVPQNYRGYVLRSVDGGAHWSVPVMLAIPSGQDWSTAFGPPRELLDAAHTILVPLITGVNTAPNWFDYSSGVAKSTDYGVTWTATSQFMTGSGGTTTWDEQAFLPRLNGSVYSVIRATFLSMLFASTSGDKGTTWVPSPPSALFTGASTFNMHRMPKTNTIYGTYRRSPDAYQVYRLSTNDTASWGSEVVIDNGHSLYGDVSDTASGQAGFLYALPDGFLYWTTVSDPAPTLTPTRTPTQGAPSTPTPTVTFRPTDVPFSCLNAPPPG